MHIILNPKYKHLQSYLEHIEEHFECEGHEIYRDRNVIRTLKVGDMTLVVKRYARPSSMKRLAQRTFRSPKAKKAYVRPLQLRERGFESPEPVAFVRCNKGWFDSTTYFVCLQSKYKYDLSQLSTFSPEIQDEVIREFARFAANLHDHGFYHRDFSADNILFDRVRDRIHFSLIDTNSISVGRPVSVEKGCANFAQLISDEVFTDKLAKYYAECRGEEPERIKMLMLRAKS